MTYTVALLAGLSGFHDITDASIGRAIVTPSVRATGTMAAARAAGFRPLWLSLSSVAFGTAIGQVALLWVTLELTQSPFAVAVTLASRLAPSLILGIPLGSLADRVDRHLLLIWANLAGAATAIAVAVGAFVGAMDVPLILLVSFVFGSIDTMRTTATQAYVYDLVGSPLATSGIALSNLGSHLASSVGAVLGGLVLASWSLGAAFLFATLTWLVAAGLLVRSPSPRASTAIQPKVSMRRTVTLFLRSHSVAAIAVLVILAEVFGFSSAALVPTCARDILLVDAAGLGVLVAARSLGGVLGLAWLATIGSHRRGGRLILGVTGAFGATLVVFALSGSFAISTIVMFVSGAAAAMLDTLGQTLLQRTAPDQERGAAMGVWVFSVGFGPIGFLLLGAAATLSGAPVVQLVSGIVLIIVALAMARFTSLPTAR